MNRRRFAPFDDREMRRFDDVASAKKRKGKPRSAGDAHTWPASEMLSPSEIEQLRRKSKETQDLASKAFRRSSDKYTALRFPR